MDVDYLIQYTLLELVCYIFVFGLLVRIFFFIFTMINESRNVDYRWGYLLSSFGRSFLPFHMAFKEKPFYSTLRYIFHAGLIVIPIWYSGHIFLWDRYGFEWNYTALPDEWVDGWTLLLLLLCGYFLMRRILSKKIRCNSRISDFAVITITAMPFLTGYLLSQGSLEFVFFFGDQMENIHILTVEAMILMVPFLFCRVCLTETICTGCASCELHCPTGAMGAEDKGNQRIFTYALYQCICCGSCINTCPENAAELRHSVSFAEYFQMLFRKTIRTVEIKNCERCGAFFAPEPQVDKLRQTVDEEYINLCLRCKREVSAQNSMLG
jgi:formate hydrogenlyase subunit 6/NADH:ubiquinone oxidoreductase subunit I